MLKRLWPDPVWSKVIATAIVGVAAIALAYVRDWAPILLSAAGWVWQLALESSRVPNWLLVSAVLLLLLVVARVAGTAWRRAFGAPPPRFLECTSDTFFNLHWRWQYSPHSSLSSSLNSFCPVSDYQVFPYNAASYSAIDRIGFECDSSGAKLGEHEMSYDALQSRVQRRIHQKIRNLSSSIVGAP